MRNTSHMNPRESKAMTTPQPQPNPAPLTLEQALALPDEELRVRVAEIAGLDVSKIGLQFHLCPQCGVEVDANHGFEHQIIVARHKAPNYPNSHDALAPVIAGLSDLDHFKYRIHLTKVVNHSLPFNPEANIEELRAVSMARGRAFHDATPRQKCVAVIMAKQKPSLPVVPAQGPPITQADIDAAQEDE